MNQIIFYFIIFVSAVKSFEESPTPTSQEVNLKSEIEESAVGSAEIKEMYSVLKSTDDLLSISDFNKIYNSLENLFAKTKYLRDENENKNIEKADAQVESRASNKVDATESLESKSEEKTGAPKKLEVQINRKSGKNEDSIKEERKSAEVTTDRNSFEDTTDAYGVDAKSSDYLENDKEADDSLTKITPNEKSGKSGEAVMPNDESNTSWDILDDLPLTRRMMPRPDQLLDMKGKTSDENSNSDIVTKGAQPPLVESTRSGARRNNPVTLVPHIHPVVARRGFHIVPGFVTSSVLPVEFRKVVNQENVNALEKDMDKTESYSERRADERSSEVNNAYPFMPSSETPQTPQVVQREVNNAYPFMPSSETPQTPQVAPANTANMVFSKLAQASQHPLRIIPNMNVHTLRGYGGMPYNLRPSYPSVPVVNMYKYVNGYGRLG